MAACAFVEMVAVTDLGLCPLLVGRSCRGDRSRRRGGTSRTWRGGASPVALPPSGWLAFQATMVSRLEGGVAPEIPAPWRDVEDVEGGSLSRCVATFGVVGVPGRDGLQVGGRCGAGRNDVVTCEGVLGLLAFLAFPHDEGDGDEEEEEVEITVE
jgi:hypothetical protein